MQVTLLETTVSGTALELPALRSPARQDVGPSGPRELSVVADMGRGVKLGTWRGVINKHAATRGGEVKGAMNNVRHMHGSDQRVSCKRFKTQNQFPFHKYTTGKSSYLGVSQIFLSHLNLN